MERSGGESSNSRSTSESDGGERWGGGDLTNFRSTSESFISSVLGRFRRRPTSSVFTTRLAIHPSSSASQSRVWVVDLFFLLQLRCRGPPSLLPQQNSPLLPNGPLAEHRCKYNCLLTIRGPLPSLSSRLKFKRTLAAGAGGRGESRLPEPCLPWGDSPIGAVQARSAPSPCRKRSGVVQTGHLPLSSRPSPRFVPDSSNSFGTDKR